MRELGPGGGVRGAVPAWPVRGKSRGRDAGFPALPLRSKLDKQHCRLRILSPAHYIMSAWHKYAEFWPWWQCIACSRDWSKMKRRDARQGSVRHGCKLPVAASPSFHAAYVSYLMVRARSEAKRRGVSVPDGSRACPEGSCQGLRNIRASVMNGVTVVPWFCAGSTEA
jgi:hypothetical protein